MATPLGIVRVKLHDCSLNRHNPSKLHDYSPNRHDPSKLHDCSPNRHDPPKLHDCTEQSWAGLYKDDTFSHFDIQRFTYIHSFHFIRERDRVLQTIRFDSQQMKCFLIVGRSFHPGRQIAKDLKHHCEGNNCLKEIVSNTRLDLQTGSDVSGFFLQTVLNVNQLLDLLYFTVLKF